LERLARPEEESGHDPATTRHLAEMLEAVGVGGVVTRSMPSAPKDERPRRRVAARPRLTRVNEFRLS
jgi:hypothetical protein